ncbi:endolytic transglycosylase MltG [Actinacidiphila sp. ITFR-21]|uniref:endolytic transglycosylase MltG n=1 Tax=Actinacidiphila sp. ITFR-21 TaxID=3075199 RepID=UPI002889C51E|nr:endolytic transglycosylase MltG [Streptomyces sp. ITFR-21]WNI14653.1 endolytic transglycosylase MltG [Streptomyces sp. ITFR-21]
MTDYGRGPGSEPWHPEDPLFGDVYDQGHGYPQQPQHPQPQHPQQQPQQDGGWQDPYANGQQPQYPQQGYPQQQYPQQPPQYPQGQQPQYPQQGYPQQAGYDPYDTGSHQSGGYGQQDPYGGQQPPQDPYGQPDFYGQNGYPPPQQPQYPQQQVPQQPGQPLPGQPAQPVPGQGQPQQGRHPGAGPQQPGARPAGATPPGATGWGDEDDGQEEADPREHAFFADRSHDDDDDDAHGSAPATAGGRRAGRSQPKAGKKRRSGCACLVVAVVLVGGLGGAGYFGYTFYQSHFGPAPDYSGQTATDVQVEIPTGATATTIGNILKDAGVVKSVDAFVSAANQNTKSRGIQAGVYVLKAKMSAAAAVTMMLDPKSQNALIIPEGTRDMEIYALVDKRLGLPSGTTRKTARARVRNLGLPAWADTSTKVKDPLEGFLFPSRYSVAKGMKPEALLRQMVGQAKQQYARFDMAGEARQQGLKSPLQLLTVASLIQAEGKTDDDFRKMAKVVYNRMDPANTQTYGLLQFDSTYNYIKNLHATNISTEKIQNLDDPYNTYKYRGLPPGPIGNPGTDALKAAMDPDPGDWYYFISLDGKTTQFTTNSVDFEKLKQQYHPQ